MPLRVGRLPRWINRANVNLFKSHGGQNPLKYIRPLATSPLQTCKRPQIFTTRPPAMNLILPTPPHLIPQFPLRNQATHVPPSRPVGQLLLRERSPGSKSPSKSSIASYYVLVIMNSLFKRQLNAYLLARGGSNRTSHTKKHLPGQGGTQEPGSGKIALWTS